MVINVVATDDASFLNYTLEVMVMEATPFVANYWIEKKDGSTSEVTGSQPPFLMAPMFYDQYIRDLPSAPPSAVGAVPVLTRISPGETDDVAASENQTADSITAFGGPDDWYHIPPRQLMYQESWFYFVDAKGNVLATCEWDVVEDITNTDPNA